MDDWRDQQKARTLRKPPDYMSYSEAPGFWQQKWALDLFHASRQLAFCFWVFQFREMSEPPALFDICFSEEKAQQKRCVAEKVANRILWLEAALAPGDEYYFPAENARECIAPGCMHRWSGFYPVRCKIPVHDPGNRVYADLMVPSDVAVGGDLFREACAGLPLATRSLWAQKWRQDFEHEAKREMCKDLVSGSKTWAFLQPRERADIANVWLPELNSGWVWEIENPDGSGMTSPMSCKAYVASGRATSLAWYLRTRKEQLDLWLKHTYEERWNLKLDSLLWQPDHSLSPKPW